MRKVVVLAAVVAALTMASQPAGARDRGFGSRQFSAPSGPKLHLRHHGFDFRHGRFLGKPRPFKSRHFGYFDHHGFAFKFGHTSRFKPRHFGHLSQGGLVLKFGDGDFVLRFGHTPHFKHRHLSHRHHHHGLFFGLDLPWQFRPWHDHGFAFQDRPGLHGHRESMPGSQGGQAGGLHAPPEALLEQLEQMGFRHLPELLRSGDP